jgi:hypothetical protein
VNAVGEQRRRDLDERIDRAGAADLAQVGGEHGALDTDRLDPLQ